MWLNLMEEKFFFQYHMSLSWNLCQKMPINERKWMIERFIQQKNRENDAIEAAKRKAKRK